MVAQLLGDGKHEVGGSRPVGEFAGQLEPDDPWDEHAHRLAEHGRLGLDAADPPAHDPQPVDHGGVAVRSDTGVGIRSAVAHHDDPGEVLDIDLMDDAGAGRNHLEVLEGPLSPAQELVPLAVALVLELHVTDEGIRGTEDVGYHRVVDDQLGRIERIDPARIPTEGGHRLAHGREIHDRGHTGEVLHDHSGGCELDLNAGLGVLVPAEQAPHVVGGDVRAVLGPQQVFQQDLQAVREPRRVSRGSQAVDLVRGVADFQLSLGAEAVQARGHRVHRPLVRPAQILAQIAAVVTRWRPRPTTRRIHPSPGLQAWWCTHRGGERGHSHFHTWGSTVSAISSRWSRSSRSSSCR